MNSLLLLGGGGGAGTGVRWLLARLPALLVSLSPSARLRVSQRRGASSSLCVTWTNQSECCGHVTRSPPITAHLVLVLQLAVLVLHVLVLGLGRRRAHGPRHARALARQRHHLLGLVLHGGQRLLHRLLANLGVVPLLAVGVPAREFVSLVAIE